MAFTVPRMASTSPVWLMADDRTDGNLAATINQYRQDGISYEGIARRLYAEHGIEVTRQTIANWIKAGRTEQVTA